MKSLFVFFFLLVSFTLSDAQTTPPITMGHRINMAARQRMLSQHMTKDYIFLWKRIDEVESKKNLMASIEAFDATLSMFHNNPLSQNIQYKITDVNIAWSAFKKTLTDPVLLIDVTSLLAQSAVVLQESEALLKEIEKYANAQPGFNADTKVDSRRSIVNVMCRQCMLSQRIAAYYVLFETNPTDENIKNQLMLSVKQMNEEWTIIQNFINADFDGFAKIAAMPEFWDVVARRKAYGDLLDSINQNKRIDAAALGTTSNQFVEVMGIVVYATEPLVGM